MKNAFGGHKDYMEEKKRKLDQQFQSRFSDDPSSCSILSAKDLSKESSIQDGIFRGVHVYITGFTDPPLPELQSLLGKNGGKHEQYLSKRVTHIVASNLPLTKVKEWKKKGIRQLKIVSPHWLVHSVEQGRLLPWIQYDLFKSLQRGGEFSTGVSSLYRVEASTKSYLKPFNPQTDLDSSFIRKESQERGEERTEIKEREQNQEKERENKPQKKREEQQNRFEQKTTEKKKETQTTIKKTIKQNPPQKMKQIPNPSLTAVDDDFIKNYYNHSRLHHLSTWKQKFRDEMAKMVEAETRLYYDPSIASTTSTTNPSTTTSTTSTTSTTTTTSSSTTKKTRLICHLDFDCFFASVAMRYQPALYGRPVAVCHSTSRSSTSTSQIACVNYVGRKFGLRNGMFVAEAFKKCPELEVVPYQFPKYEKISTMFYRILLKYSKKIQVVSCDEALIDITGCENPEALVLKIREEVFQNCGCNLSCGIGTSILVARMACRKAKPNGQKLVLLDQTDEFVASMPISSLPGVGRNILKKIEKLVSPQIQSCKDLRSIPKNVLQTHFGKKVGEGLWGMCRGIDEREIVTDWSRKSIGAEVNWGMRFTEQKEVTNFLKQLVTEVVSRMRESRVAGLRVTIKVKKAKREGDGERGRGKRKEKERGKNLEEEEEEAEEEKEEEDEIDAEERGERKIIQPYKYLGHGPCHNYSKSMTLPQFTNTEKVIFSTSNILLTELKILPVELRGLGVHMSNLITVSELSGFSGEEGGREEGNEEERRGGKRHQSTIFEKLLEKQKDREKEEEKEREERRKGKREVGDSSSGEVKQMNIDAIEGGDGSRFSEGACFVPPPTLSQLDPTVIDVLPEDIRREIDREYGRSTEEREGDNEDDHLSSLVHFVDLPNFSQLDESVLGMLPCGLRKEIDIEYWKRKKNKKRERVIEGQLFLEDRNPPKKARQQTLRETGCRAYAQEGDDFVLPIAHKIPKEFDVEMLLTLSPSLITETLEGMGYQRQDISDILKLKHRQVDQTDIQQPHTPLQRFSPVQHRSPDRAQQQQPQPQLQRNQQPIPQLIQHHQQITQQQHPTPSNRTIIKHAPSSLLFFHSEPIDFEFRATVKKWMGKTLHPSPLQQTMLSLFLQQLVFEGNLEGLQFMVRFLSHFAEDKFPQWKSTVAKVVQDVQEAVVSVFGGSLLVT